jgi:hypothetical protein
MKYTTKTEPHYYAEFGGSRMQQWTNARFICLSVAVNLAVRKPLAAWRQHQAGVALVSSQGTSDAAERDSISLER